MTINDQTLTYTITIYKPIMDINRYIFTEKIKIIRLADMHHTKAILIQKFLFFFFLFAYAHMYREIYTSMNWRPVKYRECNYSVV